MAIDRGGLDYPIVVKDGFSQGFGKFIAGVKRSREEWQAFKRDLASGGSGKGGSREMAKIVAAQKRLTEERRKGRVTAESLARVERTLNREMTRTSDEMRTQISVTTQLAQARARLRQSSQEIDQRSRALRRENRELRRQRQELERIAVASRRVRPTSTTRTTGRSGRTGTPGTGLTPVVPPAAASNAAAVASSLKRADGSANRIAFTFRRLIGIFAAFAAVRLLVNGFRSLVSLSVEFNSKLEQARLGIASLFTAVGDVRDATGQAADSAQALALAQREARRQTLLLRRDALQTASTFDNLVEVFQTGLAPGLEAGLNVDQVRAFTVQISQAASAIGLQQNQLAEEIRSILSGTIQARTTRIAVALGITNEDVRRAREAGTLAEFLEEKFGAFAEAGRESLGTFAALVTNTRDALLQVLETGGLEYFEELKSLLSEVQSGLLQEEIRDGQSLLSPSPQAVAIIKGISDGLRSAVAAGRRFLREVNPAGIAAASALVGDTLALVARLLAATLQGFLRGFADVAAVIQSVGDALDGALDVESIEDFVAVAAEGLTIFLAVQVAMAAVSGTVSLLVGVTKLWGAAVRSVRLAAAGVEAIMGGIAALSAAIASPWVILGGVLALVAVAAFKFRKEIAEALGVSDLLELKFTTIAKVIGQTIVNVVDFAITFFRNGFLNAFDLIGVGMFKIISTFRDQILQLIDGLTALAAPLVGDEFVASLQAGAAALKAITRQSDKLGDSLFKGTVERSNEVKQALEDLFNPEKNGIQDIVNNNDVERTFEEFFSDLAEGAKAVFKDALDGGLIDIETLFGSGSDGTDSFRDALEQLQPVIESTRKGIEESGKAFDTVVSGVDKAREALTKAQLATGSSGLAERFQTEVAKGLILRQKLTRELSDEQARFEARIAGLQRQRSIVQDRLVSLSARERNAVDQIRVGLEEAAALQNQSATARAQAAAASRVQAKLDAESQKDQFDALQRIIDAAEEKVRLTERELETVIEQNDATLKGAAASESARERILKLARTLVEISGQERVIREQIKGIGEDRLKVEVLVNQQVGLRIQALAREQELTARLAADRLALQNAAERARQQNDPAVGSRIGGFQTAAERQVAAAEATLATQRLVTAQLREQQATNERQFAAQIRLRTEALRTAEEQLFLLRGQGAAQEDQNAAAVAVVEARDALGAVERSITEQRRLQNEELDAAVLKTDELAQKLADAQSIAGDGISAGLEAGLEQFLTRATDSFAAFQDIALQGLNGFADTVTGIITDAFDPNKDVDIKQRFAQFLGDLAKQILAFFVKLAIAKAILGLASSAATPAATGGSVIPLFGGVAGFAGGNWQGGFAKGGAPSAAHFSSRARGYNLGGLTGTNLGARPSGLHPSDTIPAWLAPGEFVMTREATSKFLPVLEAMRRGAVNPSILNAAISRGSGGGRILKPTRGGFNTGGQVSAQAAAESSRGATTAVLLADEETFERLMSNGGNDFMERWMDDRGFRRGVN